MTFPDQIPGRSLVLQTAPTDTPVTRAEAAAQCRTEDFDDDDEFIDRLVSVATAALDPSGRGWLGAALMQQTWNLYLDYFPGTYYGWGEGRSGSYRYDRRSIELPFPPLISIGFVKYYDVVGTLTTMSASDYQVDGVGAWRKAKLWPSPNGSWPATQSDRRGAVQVQFSCGHANAGLVPATAKHAILMLVSHYYENREAVLADPTHRVAALELPMGVQNLLAPLRINF